MKRRPIGHQLDGLIALLLFGVFAVCVLAVLLTGADAYRRLTGRDQAAYDSRICVQYIATKVRQEDRVAVEDFGGASALVLGAGEYVTRVYCHDGYLMELYAAADDGDLAPEDGERVVEAGGLDLSLEEGLLTVSVCDSRGDWDTLLLSLRSGEGGAP